MKKSTATLTIIFCLFIIGLIFSAPTKVASADEAAYVYAQPQNLVSNEFAGASTLAIRDDTSGTILFYVPESYFVKLTATMWPYYNVDYMGIEDCMVTKEDVPADSVKAYEGVTESNFAPNVLLITNQSVTVDGVAVNTADGWTVKLMGYINDNLYVKALKDDVSRFGAAPKASFNTFNVSYHAIAQAERAGLLNQTPNDEPGTISSGGTSSTLRIILIIGIIIPALIIVLLLFKPNRETSGYDKRTMKKQPDSRKVDYDRDRRYGDDYHRDYRDYPDRDRDRDRDYRDRDDRDYRGRDDRDYRERTDDRDYRDN